jgi:hypothetical protein
LAVAGLALQSRRRPSSANVSGRNEEADNTTDINKDGLGRLLDSIQSEGLNQNYVAVNTRVQPGDEWF